MPTPPPIPPSTPADDAPAPIAHMLRKPKYLGMFMEEVDRAAANERDPGHEAAKWLKPQLDDLEGNGREDVIRMFEKMNVMTKMNDREEPSKFDGKKEVQQFLGMLTPEQRKSLTAEVISDDRSRINVGRAINPRSLGGMTRRSFLGGAAAAALTAMAVSENSEADKKTKQSKQPIPGDPANEFADPRDAQLQPKNRALRDEALELEAKTVVHGAGAAVAGTYGLAMLAKRVYAPHSGRFREGVRDLLVTMDPLVADTKLEAYRQRDGAGPRPGGPG